jgi:SAM-dependent methyltransferase
MFHVRHVERSTKLSKAIIDYYGHTFFYGKTVLDLGSGSGDIAAALARLGANVLCCDVRVENLKLINKNHPYLKTQLVNLETEWPFTSRFDIVLSLGVICHLKNYENHIKNICSIADNIVLETEVYDSVLLNKKPIYEEKSIPYLSFYGEGSLLSTNYFQDQFALCGASFKRVDDAKINTREHRYDWRDAHTEHRAAANRRIWFGKNNMYLSTNTPVTVNQAIPSDINSHINHEKLKTKAKIRLFYNYYSDKDPERKKEIDLCFKNNLENRFFETVVLTSEEIPNYNFFFDKINEVSGPDDINIICNSDIFFDNTISLVLNMGPRDFYALSRWEWNEGKPELRDLKNSQDTWIFRGPVRNVNGNIPLGVPFCDNRIAFEFNNAGYNVTNPSKSIKTYHIQTSNIRRYDDHARVPGPILFVQPTGGLKLPIFALTSLSPKPEQANIQKECVKSWVAAGCEVFAFQSSEEIKRFPQAEWQDVTFVEVEASKHYHPFIPISRMTNWISQYHGYALIINSDCNITMSAEALRNIVNNTNEDLTYFVRHDIDAGGNATRQPHGIDGFLFATKNAMAMPQSEILCMGKPWWDYVLPLAMLKYGKAIKSPQYMTLKHIIHSIRWSGNEYNTCRNEAVRVLGWPKNAHEMYSDICNHTQHIG